MGKDFTTRQRAQWVEQEFRKVDLTNINAINARISSENEALKGGRAYGLDKLLPNCHAAHLDLISRLMAARVK